MRDQGSGIQRLLLVLLTTAALASLVLTSAPRAQSSGAAADRLWFCPSPGSIDYLQLFENPDGWPLARQLISVFKFYQQHTQTPAPDIVGPNTYDALARAGAFRLLGEWKKKIAIEAGAVKEFYCTPDASGMNESIANTVASIRSVQAAGGAVSYLSMDDPFASGQAPVCGGPALEPTADRIATYVQGVHGAYPAVQIGFSEAFPLTSEPNLERALDLLIGRGVTPAFLHADVDSRALTKAGADFTRDMRALRQACRARGVAFGIIAWGYNGDADALYAADVGYMADEIAKAFPTWLDMPDNLVVQSWAVSSTGLLITPSNLPESQLYTHTSLLRELWHQFRGQTGPPTDIAVRKTP
jgi:hypothetical protein